MGIENTYRQEDKPFFSIIIPSYNRAHILPRAIESVVKQDFQGWELLIVDDGSTDNTRDVVSAFNDPRIFYIYQDNAERSAARNNGIKRAKGNYVCFLDSDDAYDAQHLSAVYQGIKNNDDKDAIYVVNSTVVNTEGSEQTQVNVKHGQSDMETVFLNSITPGQFVTPAETIKSCGFNVNIRISEDTEILVRLVQLLPLKVLDVYTLIYFRHDDNSVNTDKYNAFKDRKETLSLLFQNIPTSQLSGKLRRELLSNCYFGIFRYHKAQGNFWMKKWTMLQAILLYPEHRMKAKLYLLLKD